MTQLVGYKASRKEKSGLQAEEVAIWAEVIAKAMYK